MEGEKRTNSYSIGNMDKRPIQLTNQDGFAAQEFKWRTGAATFWVVTLVPALLVTFEIVMNIEPFRPFLSIQAIIDNTCTWKFLLFILPFQAICIPGSRYGVCFFTQKKYVLQFPLLQELKFVRFKASLSGCLKSAVIDCMQTLKLCFILCIITSVFDKFLDLLLLSNSGQLPSVDLSFFRASIIILWQFFVFGTTILLALNIAQSLVKIFATQAYSFVLESAFVGDQSLLMQSALVSSNQLLKHLAFLDLCKCSKFDSTRRKQIFSVTQPGGHPEVWNAVLPQCLSVIEESKRKFASATGSCLKKDGIHKTHDLFNENKTIAMQGNSSTLVKQDSIAPPFLSPSKNRNEPGSVSFHHSSSSLFSPEKTWTSTEDLKSPLKNQHQKITSGKHHQQKSLIFPGLFEELLEHKSPELFQDQQLIIWTLEGLSYLIAASFSEDTYGVVQRNLPTIIVSFLSYLETIERYIKTITSEERTQLSKIRDFQKRKTANSTAQSYKIAVQSAIYRITTRFGKNLDSLRIPNDCGKKLAAFIDYRD
eukprot:gene8134-9004_t